MIQLFTDLTTVYVRHDPEPAEYVGELWQFTGEAPDIVTLPEQIQLRHRSTGEVLAVYELAKAP